MEICTIAHYWLISTIPINGSYHAKCKKCGVEKDIPLREAWRGYRSTNGKPTPPSFIETRPIER